MLRASGEVDESKRENPIDDLGSSRAQREICSYVTHESISITHLNKLLNVIVLCRFAFSLWHRLFYDNVWRDMCGVLCVWGSDGTKKSTVPIVTMTGYWSPLTRTMLSAQLYCRCIINHITDFIIVVDILLPTTTLNGDILEMGQ